jgi:hypothetical protein
MRYGQAISEQGVGGMTTGQQGSAGQSYGHSEGNVDKAKARTAAGYGGDRDMDRNVGA